MKSKELIEEYIKECDKDGWVEYEGKYWKPELQIIFKDLEILEILRPHLITARTISVDNEIFHLTLTLNGEEYNKLKEWSKNESE